MLTFEHGNKVGSGSRLCIGIESGEKGGSGRIVAEIYGQTNDEGTASSGRARWEFNDPNPAHASLTATQTEHLLSVLRGREESVMNGKGLIVKSDMYSSLIHLDAVESPFSGFAMHITTLYANGEKAEGRITLNQNEGSAILTALESAMGRVAFGV